MCDWWVPWVGGASSFPWLALFPMIRLPGMERWMMRMYTIIGFMLDPGIALFGQPWTLHRYLGFRYSENQTVMEPSRIYLNPARSKTDRVYSSQPFVDKLCVSCQIQRKQLLMVKNAKFLRTISIFWTNLWGNFIFVFTINTGSTANALRKVCF